MCTRMAKVLGRKYSQNLGMNLQKTKMQCKLRCGTQVGRSEKSFAIFLCFFCSVFENVEQRMMMRKMSFDKCCRLKEEKREGGLVLNF